MNLRMALFDNILDMVLDMIFPRNRYGIPGLSLDGVQLRSSAERRIAGYFNSIGLRYEYEKELEAGFWIFKRKIASPDFYLPEHDVYVEYWGLLDVPDDGERKRYVRAMKYKMGRYQQLGIKCISLYPHNLGSLDRDFRKKFKQTTGAELV